MPSTSTASSSSSPPPLSPFFSSSSSSSSSSSMFSSIVSVYLLLRSGPSRRISSGHERDVTAINPTDTALARVERTLEPRLPPSFSSSPSSSDTSRPPPLACNDKRWIFRERCSRYETVGRALRSSSTIPFLPFLSSFWLEISKGTRVGHERGRERTKMEYLNRPFSLFRSSHAFHFDAVAFPVLVSTLNSPSVGGGFSIGIRIFTSRGKSRRHLIFHARGGGGAARRRGVPSRVGDPLSREPTSPRFHLRDRPMGSRAMVDSKRKRRK